MSVKWTKLSDERPPISVIVSTFHEETDRHAQPIMSFPILDLSGA